MAGYENIDGMEEALSDDAVVNGDTGNEESSQLADASASEQPDKANQNQQTSWNGQEWSLKYRGDPYVPKSRDELINLAQKGFSYTQEMEKFNRERKSYQEQLNSLQGKYKNFETFEQALKNNPAFAQRLMQVAQEFQSQQSEQQNQGGVDYTLINNLQSKVEQLEAMNSERINNEYDRKLSETLQNIRKSYPNHDWEFDDGTGNLEKKLLQFAYDNGITNLDYAYRAMMWDQNSANAKSDALKKAAAAKQAATKAGVLNTSSSAGGTQVKPGYKYGDTWNDLTQRMAAEMKT